MPSPQTRLGLACPCCQGEVTRPSYSFIVLETPGGDQPPKFGEWLVCAECEALLRGNDPVARATVERAFLDYLEGRADAPATARR